MRGELSSPYFPWKGGSFHPGYFPEENPPVTEGISLLSSQYHITVLVPPDVCRQNRNESRSNPSLGQAARLKKEAVHLALPRLFSPRTVLGRQQNPCRHLVLARFHWPGSPHRASCRTVCVGRRYAIDHSRVCAIPHPKRNPEGALEPATGTGSLRANPPKTLKGFTFLLSRHQSRYGSGSHSRPTPSPLHPAPQPRMWIENLHY